jgi:hypothetical protein
MSRVHTVSGFLTSEWGEYPAGAAPAVVPRVADSCVEVNRESTPAEDEFIGPAWLSSGAVTC